MKLKYLGLAFVELISSNNKTIYFDPWDRVKGNPNCPIEIKSIKKADIVLVSHDHEDHIGSAIELCNNTGALIGGSVETMQRLISDGLNQNLVVNNGQGYLPGGGFDFDGIEVISTPAYHTSRTGCAMGHIVIMNDGTTIYHTGDTSLIAEMLLYSRIYDIDVLLVPIGGGGTMDAYQAAEAVKLVQPKKVMPIHFEWNSDPQKALEDFKKYCLDKNPEIEIIEPISGKYIEIVV